MGGSTSGTAAAGSGSYTYTYSPGTTTAAKQRDLMRLLLGDTDVSNSGANAMFADEELAYFWDEGHGNTHLAAHHACVAAAAKYSQMANKTLGPMSIQYGQISQAFRDQAKEEFGNATNTANVSPSAWSYMMDTTEVDPEDEGFNVPPIIKRRMMNNYADTSAGASDEERTHWTFG